MLATDVHHETPPASRIAPRLWQGSVYMLQAGILEQFQVLVLCAREIQPTKLPRHLKVMRCPLVDEERPFTEREAENIMHTARRAARGLLLGRRTLITCAAGLNRSGVVTATTLHMLTGKPGFECVKIVRRQRQGALFNRAFVESLYALY
jgi:protein-tyrosine phosphatase